jgi:hypothetical protein
MLVDFHVVHPSQFTLQHTCITSITSIMHEKTREEEKHAQSTNRLTETRCLYANFRYNFTHSLYLYTQVRTKLLLDTQLFQIFKRRLYQCQSIQTLNILRILGTSVLLSKVNRPEWEAN